MTQRRLFWAVVDKIEEKITSGEYVPGARLPPERVLAEELVSVVLQSEKLLLLWKFVVKLRLKPVRVFIY